MHRRFFLLVQLFQNLVFSISVAEFFPAWLTATPLFDLLLLRLLLKWVGFRIQIVNDPSLTCSWFVWRTDFATIGGIKWRFEARLNKTLQINNTELNTHFIFVCFGAVSVAVQLSVTGLLGI